MKIEEQYEDVLQNIEFAIVQIYRQNPDLADWNVDKVVSALARCYKAETRGRAAPKLKFSEVEQGLFDFTQGMCEFRLGRQNLERMRANEDDGEETSQEVLLDMKSLTPDEIITCLKRIRKSIKLWTKQGGQRGYLTYVDQFFP